MNVANLFASVQAELEQVEAQLHTLVQSPVSMITDVGRHLLTAGGKRLRPALYLLCAKNGSTGTLPPEAVPLAAAIEMIHMATLIHDDVIDDAPIRRGLPTANICWGNRRAVLAGDYLFAAAFNLAALHAGNETLRILTDVVRSICEGEILQSQECFLIDITEENYLRRTAKKTADFIAASCRLGGMSAKLPADAVEALAQYGHALGMAFQITDDILDVTASAHQLGKPVGNDLRQGIITLPVIYTLRSDSQGPKLASLLNQKTFSEAEVTAALDLVREAGAIDYSYKYVQSYLDLARRSVPSCLAADIREALLSMADYIAARSY